MFLRKMLNSESCIAPVLLLGLFVMPFQASATNLIQSPCSTDTTNQDYGKTCTDAVLGLQVGSVMYDVEFIGLYQVGSMVSKEEALARSAALAAALAPAADNWFNQGREFLADVRVYIYFPYTQEDLDRIVGPQGPTPNTILRDGCFVGAMGAGGAECPAFEVTHIGFRQTVISYDAPAVPFPFAMFTARSLAVPEAGTLGLLGLGLAGFGLTRRRKAS